MASQARKLVWTDVKIPQTNVSVYEALHRRRMSWTFEDKPVNQDVIERMLAAAVWAPNHRMNEPWRFFVIPKDSPVRRKIADAIFEALLDEWKSEKRAEPYREKVLAPPFIIFTYHVADADGFVEKENYAALIAAMQNISLAGVAEGIAVTWDTGRVVRVPAVSTILGAEDNWNMTAMLSIGYAAEESASARTPVTEFARWV